MRFSRTQNGLSNQHLFYSVDYIVYVEGGESFSKEDVYNGNYKMSSNDITFWKGIFSTFSSGKTFHFRSVGSKRTLLSIIEDIESENLNNIYVALDRDYDNLSGRLSNSGYVIYTYGYSWENDVWSFNTVLSVLDSLFSTDNADNNIENEINDICKIFFNDIKIAVFADAMLINNGESSFIPRKKHLSCLCFGKSRKPKVNCDKVNDLLATINYTEDTILSFGVDHDIQPEIDCYGHLLSDFFYWVTIYIANKIIKIPAIPKSIINSVAIDKLISNLNKSYYVDIYQHYEASLSVI